MLLAVCQYHRMEFDVVPRIGFLFAGGGAAVCGAVAGAIMALSLKIGRPDDMEEGFRAMNVAQEFRRRFEAEMGTSDCRALTGFDLSLPAERQKYMASDTAMRVCFPAVAAAYRLTLELLASPA